MKKKGLCLTLTFIVSIAMFVMGFAITFAPTTAKAEAVTVSNELQFAEAIANADDGDEIVLSNDLVTSNFKLEKDAVIDLNGNTLTLTSGGTYLYNGNIKDGTINISGCVASGDCIIGVGDYSNNGVITFDNVNIVGDGYSSAYAVLYVYNSSILNFNGGSIIVANDNASAGGVIKAHSAANGKINIIGSENDPVELQFTNAKIGMLDGTAELNYVDLDIVGGANAINQTALTVRNSTIDITGADGRGITLSQGDVIVENSQINLSDCAEGEIRFKKSNTLYVDSTSSVSKCTIYADASATEAKINEYVVTGTETNPDKIIVSNGEEEICYPVLVNGVGYKSFDSALLDAKNLTGDVTIEISEKVTLNTSLSGNYESITFVGNNADAEIYLDVQGYITATGKKVVFKDLTLSKVKGGFITNAGFMNVAFGVYDVVSVNYTNCVFANGAYASSGEASFIGCTFYRSHDKYGLWAYGNVDATVDDCTFADYRGIKMYAEGGAKTTDLTVKNTDFTNATDKPAIVLTYGKSVTLLNNDYPTSGVFELDADGDPDGTIVTSDKMTEITCVNDNNPNGCGVIIDGKIYTTLTDAVEAEVIVEGSDVTLLYDSAEKVEFPDGVNFDTNGKDNQIAIRMGGEGTQSNPYTIGSLAQLKYFRDSVNTYTQDGSNQYKGKFIKLTADIDLADDIDEYGNQVSWTPIGTNSVGDHMSFLGTFDGDGHTISNLYILSDGDHLGFFARTGDRGDGHRAYVKNVTFNNVDVSANITDHWTTGHGDYVAGVIANAKATTEIDNVHVTGNVYIVGCGYVGGIIGHGYPKVYNSSVKAEEGSYIHGGYWCVGGIIGYAGEGGTKIENCSVENVDIWTAYGAGAAIAGLLQYDNNVSNVSAKNVKISSNSDYCMGYIVGNGEESNVSNVTIENVTAKANGKEISSTDITAMIGNKAYATIEQAIKAVTATEEIVLYRDVEISSTIRIESDDVVTIDLNGYDINGLDKVKIAIMSYGDLTIKDSTALTHSAQTGAIKAGVGVAGNAINICAGTFTLESGEIYSKNNAILIDEESAIINIKGGVITAEPSTKNSAAFYVSSKQQTEINVTGGTIVGYNGILLWNNTEINVSGGSIEGKGSVGIQGNGAHDNTEINIFGDAKVSGHYTAVYHPQGGDITISDNAELSGYTGIALKGGNLIINGGTIKGTGEKQEYIPVSSGFVDTGDALYVENFGSAYGTPTVTVNGGNFISVYGDAVASYSNASNNVESLKQFVRGGTFNTTISNDCIDENVDYICNADGSIAVGDDAEVIISTNAVAKINNAYYLTLAQAIASAKAGDVIALVKDVELSETLSIAKNKEIIIDLNGMSITGTDNSTGSFSLIDNRGTLTITDNASNGAITLVAMNDRDFNYFSSVISNNPGGTLIIEGGLIEHLGGTDMAYAIDNLTNGRGTYASTTVNGGVMKSTYRAIRQFLNGVEATNELIVNGGTIEGANKSVWFQDPSKNANSGKIEINEGATLIGDVYLFVTPGSQMWPVYVAINGSALKNGSTVLSANLPDGHVLQEKEGNYSVLYVEAQIGNEYYNTLQDAIGAVQEGQTIILLRDVVVETPAYGQNALNFNKAVNCTIDLNGFNLSADTGNSVFRFNISGSGATSDVEITIKNGTIVSGSNTWCTVMASGISSDVKAIMNLEDLTIENSKAGDLAVKAWENGVINAKNVTVNSTNGAGGFYAVGGEIVLDNCTVNQKGLHTAPYLSMAVAVSNNGKMTINSGNYSAQPTSVSEAYNQGSTHGSFVGGVMSTGGTLIINGGTFSNDNFGDDSLATYPRGLFNIDAGGKLFINDGTFNSLASVVYIINNVGDANNNPKATINGGNFIIRKGINVFSGYPQNNVTVYGGTYNVEVAQEFCAENHGSVANDDGTYDVILGVKTYEVGAGKTFADAIAQAKSDRVWDATYVLYGATELSTGFSHGIVDFGAKTVTIIGGDASAKLTIVGGGVPDIKGVTIKDITFADEGTYLPTANEFMYQNFIDTTFVNVTFEDGVRLSGNTTLTDCAINVNTNNEYAIWLDNGNFTITGSKIIGGNDAYGLVKSDEADTLVLENNVFEYLGFANKEALNVKNVSITATNNTFIDCTEGILPADKTNYDANGVVLTEDTIKQDNITIINHAKIGDVKYETLQDAINNANANDVIVLIQDVELDGVETLTVAKDKVITIDLNGYLVSKTVNFNVTKNDELLENKGTLTIIDSVGTGSIVYDYNGAETDYAISVISNEQGSLILNGVTVKNISNLNYSNNFAIDSLTNGNLGDANLSIQNSTIICSTFRSIRQFANSSECVNNLTITNSTIEGQVWLQSPNASQNIASLSINGGSYKPTGRDGSSVYITTVNSTELDVEITAGTFATKIGVDKLDNIGAFISGGEFAVVNTAYILDTARFIVNSDGSVAVGNDADAVIEANAVAKVGNAHFDSFANAVAYANDQKGDVTIELLKDSDEDVIIKQSEGLNIIVEGNGRTYGGTIIIYGNARYTGAETLTIKNVNFVTDEAGHYFIDSNSTGSVERYAHNVTVTNSTFTAMGKAIDSAAAMRIRQGYNIAIENVQSTNMHSVLQAYGNTGIKVDNLTIAGGKNGLSMGSSTKVVVNNSNISVSGYGIRADGSGNYDMTVSGNTISAELPIVVRNATGAYTVTMIGNNTLNGTNNNGYQVIFTAGDDGTYLVPSGDATLIIPKDNNVVVYGAVAKVNDAYYTSLNEAINSALKGDSVITLLADAYVTEAIKLDNELIINLNGFTLNLPALDNYAIVVRDNLTINGDGRVVANGRYAIGLATTCTGTLTINGGEFIQENGGYLFGVFGGKLVINNGRFYSSYCVVNSFAGYDGEVEIKGGEFAVDLGNSDESSAIILGENVEVLGGIFNEQIPEKYWAYGYIVVGFEEYGYYGVITVVEYADMAYEYLLLIADEYLASDIYNQAGINGFNLILAEAKAILEQAEYKADVDTAVYIYANEFAYVLNAREQQTAYANAILEVRDYASINNITYSESFVAGIEEAYTELDFLKIVSSAMDVIDEMVAEFEALKLTKIEELKGTNGEDAIHVTTAMVASIYSAKNVQELDKAFEVAKVEIQEIKAIKKALEDIKTKADENAAALLELKNSIKTLDEKVTANYDVLLENITNAIGAIGEVKTVVDEINGKVATSSELKTAYENLVYELSEAEKRIKETIVTEVGKAITEINKANEALLELKPLIENADVDTDSIISKIDALRNEDLTQLKSALQGDINGVKTVVDGIADRVSINGGLYEEITSEIRTLVEGLVSTNNTNYTTLKDRVEELFSTTNEKIDDVDELIDGAITTINTILEKVDNIEQVSIATASDIAEKYAEILKELGETEEAILKGVGECISALATEINGIKETVNEIAPIIGEIKTIAGANTTKAEEILTAIKGISSVEIGNIQEDIDNLILEVVKVKESLATDGPLVDAIINGVRELLVDIASNALSAATNAQQAASNAQQAASNALQAANNATSALAAANSALQAATDAQSAADVAKGAANEAKVAVEQLTSDSAQAKDAAEAAKSAAEKAEIAAKAAEEATKIAIEKTQTAEIKAHVATTTQELEGWVKKYVDDILVSIGAVEAPAEQTAMVTNGVSKFAVVFATEGEANFRTELANSLKSAYSEENARLVLAYYDQAIAQMNVATSKEEIDYTLESFKANVALVASLASLATEDNTLLIWSIVIDVLIAIAIICVFVYVTRAKRSVVVAPVTPSNDDTPKVDVIKEETISATAVEEVESNEDTSSSEMEETVSTEEEPEEDTESTEEGNLFDSLGKRKSKTFEERLNEADDQLKANYQTIIDEFTSYKKVNARISKRCVSIRRGRILLSKMIIRGKSIKCFIALNPKDYEITVYHHSDSSEKKAYQEVPMTVRIRSPRSVKKAVRLINDVATKFNLDKKA